MLSTDALRERFTGSEADTTRDRQVFSVLGVNLNEQLKMGRTTVIDATNLGRRRRRRYVDTAGAAGRPVIAIRFEAPIPDLLARNAKRLRRVPPGAVIGMARDMAVNSTVEDLITDGCDLVFDADQIELRVPECRAGREAQLIPG